MDGDQQNNESAGFDPDAAMPEALRNALAGDATAAERESARPYSTRGWGELHDLDLPPRVCFWGETFALGQLQVVFGQGGLGKSRVALNHARNQILRLPFCGLATGTRPLRHLLMGSENSIHRLQGDVRAMSQGLTPEQIGLLEEHLRMATLEKPGDCFITVADVDNLKRWEQTIEACRPEVLWVDPWGDVLVGDGLDRDVRETLATLNRLARQANPDCAIVVLAHSRTGAQNIALAVGFGAADFGKGSKALYSAARAVVNLAPFTEADNPAIVSVCAKSNDAPRFPAFLMSLDPETRTYDTLGPVDIDAWREDVRASQSEKRSATREARKPKIDFDATRRLLVGVVNKSPANTKALLHVLEVEGGLTQANARSALFDALSAGVIAKTRTKTWPAEMLHHLPGEGL